MKTVLALVLGLSICHGTRPPIIYKSVETYNKIYDDSGTGADRDVSIWRPKDFESGYYYPLGDVAVANHNGPHTSAIMVRSLVDGALQEPASFTEVWNDRGSGGDDDVRIMQMNPRPGYTCLGHVAIIGFNSVPDKTNYRCVASQYVTTGRYEEIWKDEGSGAHSDVGLWRNERGSDTQALDANTFTSFGHHHFPGGAPSMLSGLHAHNHLSVSLSNGRNYVFYVYEVTQFDQIWNDRGSGARRDVSIWRSRDDSRSNVFSLGDIAVGTYHPRYMKGFVVKALADDAFRPAINFRKVWDDRGSGASWDGAFYTPICLPGYRSLGHVAMRNHHERPPTNSIRCVKDSYTTRGRWEWVWNDGGSGADDDVTVWKAIPERSGQGVEAMSTVRRHGDMGTTAYVLRPDLVNYVVGPAVKEYSLSNLRYAIPDVKNNEPDNLQRTIVENQGSIEQKVTRDISITYEETYSWGNTAGLEISVSTTISTGVPLVTSGGVTVSTTASYTHEWGGSITESKTDTASVEVTVPPHSKIEAVLVGNRYQADIPYTATLTTVYEDDTRNVNNDYRGIFKGVQVNEIRVTYENAVPLGNNAGGTGGTGTGIIETGGIDTEGIDTGGIDTGGIETGGIETGGFGGLWPPPFVDVIDEFPQDFHF